MRLWTQHVVMNSHWSMLCIDQTATFIYEKQSVKTIRFLNYTFHLISAEWKWKKHFWFSIDLLFITIFENEISAKSISSNEKTSNVKNFCVRTSTRTIQKKRSTFDNCSQTLLIEFVFRIIFFIWFLQNENEENNFAI